MTAQSVLGTSGRGRGASPRLAASAIWENGFVALLLRRLPAMIPLLLTVVTLAFVLTRVLPGDPTRALGGPYATEESLAALRAQYGLDDPLWRQYLDYLAGLLRFDLGTSLATGQPVVYDLAIRIGSTLELIGLSMLLALLIGIPAGAYAGRTRSRSGQMIVRVLSFIVLAVPDFWLGLMAIFLLFFLVGVAPAPTGQLALSDRIPPEITGARLTDALLAGDMALVGSALSHAALPVIVLGIGFAAPITRLMRTSMLATMSADFILFARANGLGRVQSWRYAVRASLPPTVTYVGVLFTGMLGGAVLIESIFSWGGVAQYGADAIALNDYNAVQGFVLMCGVLSLFAFLVVDVLNAWIDPRTRIAQPPTATRMTAVTGARRRRIAPRPFSVRKVRVAAASAGDSVRALGEFVVTTVCRVPDNVRLVVTSGNVQLLGGASIIVGLVVASFAVPGLSQYDPMRPDVASRLLPPSGVHWFGTDANGSDIFARVALAARLDLTLAVQGVALGALIGVVIGLMVGMARGRWLPALVMRLVDVSQAFPVLVIAIALVTLTGNDVRNVVWAIALVNAPLFLRLVTTEVMSVRTQRYVEAAYAMGNGRIRVTLQHVFPNSIGSVIAQCGMSLGYAILVIAGLAFLGVGVQAPTAEWGSMILAGQTGITTGHWWIALFPGLALFVAVTGFNLISEGVERMRAIHS